MDVVEGTVTAGRAVRLAAERHLRDQSRQRAEDFPYYWDPAAAKKVINFFPAFLTIYDGRPFVLPRWLQFAFGSVFGWKRTRDSKRRYKVAFLETAKGSAKTPAAGGLGLYGLAFDDEREAEIYSAGFDKGQASLILNDAIRMANDSPDLLEILEVGTYNIAHLASASFFRAVSSEHRSKSGPRPYILLIDEVHEHRGPTVINKLTAGFKFRAQPIQLELTNSGDDRTSICWQHHAHSLDVLNGVVVDESWFAFVCHLDPCDACYAKGHREPQDGCDACDNWTDPAVWPKANPALEDLGLPSREYLQSQVDTALAMPSDMGLVKRLNFCIWTQSHTVWIQPDAWEACRVASVAEHNEHRACAVGFDMSDKLDLTAGVVALRVDDDPATETDMVEITDIEDDREVSKTFELNFHVELVPFFWLPEDTLIARVRQERIPFDVWRAAGALRVTPGPVIDHDLIYKQFTSDIGVRYRPQRVGYDAHNATQFAVALRDRGKFEIVDVPQGRKLSETFKLFEALVRLKRIRHAGNPVMGWCVANAEPRRDRYENCWLEKASPTKRIDGVIAAVIALNQLIALPAQRKKRRGALVYTPGGFRPVTSGMDGHAHL
jgi:phage terminase large subunit-like protein